MASPTIPKAKLYFRAKKRSIRTSYQYFVGYTGYFRKSVSVFTFFYLHIYEKLHGM